MKILLLVWNKESIMTAICHGFQLEGHEVLSIDIQATSKLFDVLKEIDSFKPDFCFTHNFYVFDSWIGAGEALEQEFQKKGIPVGTWYWDSPRSSGYYKLIQRFTFGPRFPTDILFFVVDKSHQSWLQQRGIPVSYLPIGVDDEFFSKPASLELRKEFECDISFVGRPCPAAQEKVQDQENLWRIYLHLTANDFHNFFAQTGSASQLSNEKIKEQLQLVGQIFYEFYKASIYTAEECEARSQYCLQIAEKVLVAPVFKEYSIYASRLEFFYSWFQLNYLLLSLSQFDLSVYGGDLWAEKLLPGYKKSSRSLTNEEMHASFVYSRISFCHTKWQFKTGVHERPLLVLASGGFPLTDYRSGILDLFRPGEIAVYHDEEELLDLTNYYLSNESAREEIRKKGRARVLKDHTYKERSKVIISEMKRHFNL